MNGIYVMILLCTVRGWVILGYNLCTLNSKHETLFTTLGDVGYIQIVKCFMIESQSFKGLFPFGS